jgi:hypothetical protein
MERKEEEEREGGREGRREGEKEGGRGRNFLSRIWMPDYLFSKFIPLLMVFLLQQY